MSGKSDRMTGCHGLRPSADQAVRARGRGASTLRSAPARPARLALRVKPWHSGTTFPCGAQGEHRRRGVVMIVTLLAVILLAALVLWVLNLGQQVNRRVAAQHAADAAARAGAGWVARSLNTVAHNNIRMVRTLALINILDPLPQATKFSLRETEAFHDRLEVQLRTGISVSSSKLNRLLVRAFRRMEERMSGSIEQLETFTDHVSPPHEGGGTLTDFGSGLGEQIDYDMAWLTDYKRDGNLWRSLRAMDELNQRIMDNLGEMAQSSAVSGGRAALGLAAEEEGGASSSGFAGASEPAGDDPANERSGAGSAAFMLPLSPTVPHRRGRFLDFQRPLSWGMPPESADDRRVRRGPWDTLYGWRDTLHPWDHDGGGGGPPSIDLRDPYHHGRSYNKHSIFTSYDPRPDLGPALRYRTYGPQEWLLRRIEGYARHFLPYTRLAWYERRLAEAVGEHLFPQPLEPRRLSGTLVEKHNSYPPDPDRVRRWFTDYIVNPEWITDINRADDIATADESRIKETAFFMISVHSRFPRDHPRFMAEGSYRVNRPRLLIRRGWRDPDDLERRGLTRTMSTVWRDDWQFDLLWDRPIGIWPRTPGGEIVTARAGAFSLIWQRAYAITFMIFAGVNVGNEAEVHNPYSGFDPASPAAPAPMLLDHDALDHDQPNQRWRHLSYLALARRSDLPQAWPGRFRGGRPAPFMLALAQAHVFNNHSWDLWTPMWRAELEPISRYDQWAAKLTQGPAPPGIPPDVLADLQAYMIHSSALAEAMLGH